MEKRPGNSRDYVPDEGDVVWLDFDPVLGHEQGGHRPALVLSSRKFNVALGLALCVPITSKVKGYPFEVSIGGISNIAGVVLCEQIRCIAWKERGAKLIGRVSKEKLLEVVDMISVLFPSEQ